MRQRIVLQTGVFQNGHLDGIISRQITEIDQGCSLYIWPATSPKTFDARLSQNLLESIHEAMYSHRFSLQPPFAFHLNLSLDQVSGGSHKLAHSTSCHASHNLFPQWKSIFILALQSVSNFFINAHSHSGINGMTVQSWKHSTPKHEKPFFFNDTKGSLKHASILDHLFTGRNLA